LAVVFVALCTALIVSRATATDNYNSPIAIPSGLIPLGVNWKLIPMTGWGTFGENLLEHLLAGGHFYPLLAREQDFWGWSVLSRLQAEQSALPKWFADKARTNFPILHATSGTTFVPGECS
jgi:hypothetical protein